jgi:acylphosphatase
MSDSVTRRLRIHGRVQGVWFRESMRLKAEALGVNGWVRNRMDGTVEALVQGPFEAVDALTAWARRGPEDAEVTGVDIAQESAPPMQRFEKKPSA